MRKEQIVAKLKGRWQPVLMALGVPKHHLNREHGPCPSCGGKDRYRWSNKDGNGGYFCTSCGPGSGIDVLMRAKAIDFNEARRLLTVYIETNILPGAEKDKPKYDPERNLALWGSAQPLNGDCPASRFLIGRGFRLPRYPAMLRFHPRVPYRHADGHKTHHPAMLALFVSPDTQAKTVHLTYLNAYGDKATVPDVRKFMPGPIPPGGAVRLAASGEVLGVAEGIETAMAASLIHDVPVWATLSVTFLTRWKAPPHVKQVIVFGDADRNYAGQYAAYGLAHRLEQIDKVPCEVKLPPVGMDWNDVLKSMDAEFLEAAE